MEKYNTGIKELNDSLNALELSRQKYFTSKILVNILHECINNELFEEKLRTKIQNILLQDNLEHTLTIGKSSPILLGIEFSKEEFDYGEKKIIQHVLTKSINEKFEKISREFFEITGERIEDISKPLCSETEFNQEEQYLFETKATMLSQRQLYLNNLQKQQLLLEEIAKLRTERLQDVSKEKVKQYQVESTMNLRKAEVIADKVKTDIFMECNYSLNSYKTLIEDIKKQQEECREVIKSLENTQDKYSQVYCKQFDELLKTFKQYKAAIEKKRIVCDNLTTI